MKQIAAALDRAAGIEGGFGGCAGFLDRLDCFAMLAKTAGLSVIACAVKQSSFGLMQPFSCNSGPLDYN